ncbi:hypothetical protein [Pseudoalteromonas sp. OOF1S-7]|uniref:hypothetical protein n=1 Tax=Pseudoalteromonas sp. OOF1S-7 TaxID=2917757 RepID=UPI001EF6D97F|nr:hypothetical protein [Pseudoalteromonas sp. OOF1S-7]MCG7537338.1 hypothetical protein [Pseudoalteromonas sp. OOF1S-7]
MEIEIFISKGGDESTAQRAFVDAVIDALKTAGIKSRIMYENEWSHEQPLKVIKKTIGECDGLLVIAYTRSEFEEGKELRSNKEKELNNIKLPTTWTHIEGAIAYTYELPIWILAESGLKSEGLIEKGYDWNVYWSELDVEEVKSDKFRGYLQSWKQAMEERKLSMPSSDPDVDLSKLSIGKLLSMISLPQLGKLIGVIVTVLTLVASGSYKLGAGKWPWQEEPNNQMQQTQKTRG